MISPVEMRRIVAEWRVRLQRIKEIVQPQSWNEPEWRQFSQALALLVREHGRSWIIDPNVYWDLRWKLQDGGELICQVEHVPGEKTSLVVAQNGGFAEEIGSYTWLWAEFDMEGEFAREPYWVDGTWKEALTALLLPLERQSSYLLAGRAETPNSLLLPDGARPNEGNYPIAFLNHSNGTNGNGHHENGNGNGHYAVAPLETNPVLDDPISFYEQTISYIQPLHPLMRTDYQNFPIPRPPVPLTPPALTRPEVFLHR